MKTSLCLRRQWLIKNAAFAFTLTALFNLGASAAPPVETRSAKISFADLDLSTHAGLITARRRLHETAHSLCSNFAHPGDFLNCVDAAESAALRELGILKAIQSSIKVARN